MHQLLTPSTHAHSSKSSSSSNGGDDSKAKRLQTLSLTFDYFYQSQSQFWPKSKLTPVHLIETEIQSSLSFQANISSGKWTTQI